MPRHRLHSALLTLKFLKYVKGPTTSERHWIAGKTAELNQPAYFKYVFTSECNLEYGFHLEKNVLLLFPQEKSYGCHQHL